MTTTRTPGDDVAGVKDLASWCAERGMSPTAVQVGGARIELMPALPAPRSIATEQDDARSTYRTFGGAAFDELERMGVDDDDEPAVTQ